MAVPDEEPPPPDAAKLQDELNHERGLVVQLTKKFNDLLTVNQNLDSVSRSAMLEQKKSEEKCEQQEKMYKETIEQLEMRNRILESIVTDYKDEMIIARRGEAAQKEQNDFLEAEKLVLEASNHDLKMKNKKLEEEMAVLLAEKAHSPAQMVDEKKPVDTQETDPYEAEIINLNEHITAQQKKIAELSAEAAEKNDYMFAVDYLEKALNKIEKEHQLQQMNYHVDRDAWNNREARYIRDLDKIKMEKDKLTNELANWKDATEKAITKLQKTSNEMYTLQQEKAEWTKKDKVYEQMDDILANTKRSLQRTIDESRNDAKEAREKLREISAEKENLQIIMDEQEELIRTLQPDVNMNRQLVTQLSSANELKTFLQRENDELKQKVTQLESKEMAVTCKICYGTAVQKLFQCGHSSCDNCFPYLNGCCHICRRAITLTHQLYFN